MTSRQHISPSTRKGLSRRGGLIGFFYELFRNRTLYAMLLPAMGFVALFSYVPMVGIYYAFTNYNYVGGLFGSPFVGLSNFRFFFYGGTHSPVWELTRNTLLYNIVFIFVGNFMQCLMAVLLTGIVSRFFRRVTQTLMLLPYFVSFVIVGTIAYNIFNVEFGSLNTLLKALDMSPINLYSQPAAWPFIITFFNIWKGLGYGTVIYLAAIMGIDSEIYEAARIDGCSIFQEIRLITLPLLKPTIVTLILFALGGIMRGQFDLFYQLIGRNGQLFPTTDIIDTYVYRSLTFNFNIGLSTAAGLYQSLFGLITVMTINLIVRKVDPENALF
ncbi:MAG: ABC transporter permease subunit [Oscillospiraceae bacterium]|jgi:putative aldouronate transport system permease protein|nr:ABC transporter permease subunit [Oscillospiraceae bacterium]